MKKWIVILFFSFIASILPSETKAQADTALIDALVVLGDDLYQRKSYDSSLIRFLSALSLAKKYNMMMNPRTPIICNYIGDNYAKKKEATKAHEYYVMALELSRKLSIRSEKEKALSALIALHRQIVLEDLDFRYPSIAETEETEVFFPISNIKAGTDSVDLVLLAGRIDGLGDSLRSVGIYTHHSSLDTVYHNSIRFYGTARVVKIGNNQTQLRVKKHPQISLLAGDIGAVRTNVPLSWRKLSLRKFLLSNLYLVDNYRQPHYHYRYFYYYMDSLLENDVLSAIKGSISEVVEMYAGDTLTNEQFGRKNVAGIFAGMNVMKAMSLSGPADIRLFLNFVNRFPGKYVSNNYKVAETYATWIISNSPLDPPDLKPLLLAIKNRNERRKMAVNLKYDVQTDKAIDKWVDEGMEQVNVENIRDAIETANLINDVTSAIGDQYNAGWSDYLFANIEKKMNQENAADSFMNSATRKFSAASNRDGENWVGSMKKLWQEGNKIKVGVQIGHMLYYSIAQSKNSRYFATGSFDGLVKIWDRTHGKVILTLRDHTAGVNSISYSPNGRYLVSAGNDNIINVWNAHTYTTLYSYKTESAERVVRVSPDNEFLVSAGSDSTIKFRELRTGKIVKRLKLHKGTVNDLFFHPLLPTVLYSAGSDSMVYKWDIESGEMVHWYRQKGKILSVKLSNDGNYMSLVSTDSLVTVWNTETHDDLFWGRISVTSPGTAAFFGSETFSPDNKYIAYPFRKDSFVVIRIHDKYERVYPTAEKNHNLCDLQFTNDGNGLFARFDQRGPLRVYNFAGWHIQDNPVISYTDISSFESPAFALQFSQDDNSLILLHSEISRLDLRSGHSQRLFFGNNALENRHLVLKNEKLGTFLLPEKGILSIYDYEKNEVLQKFELPGDEQTSAFEFSPDNEYCFLGGKNGSISGWDVNQNKTLFTARYNFSKNSSISKIYYDKFRKRILVIGYMKYVLALDAMTGARLDSIDLHEASHLAIGPDNIYITTETGWLYKYDANELSMLKKIQLNGKGEESLFIALSPDNKYILVQGEFYTLTGIRVSDDSIMYNLRDHEEGGTMIAISHDSKMAATAGLDSKVTLYETATGKKIVDIHLPLNRTPMFTDTEGHYLASKNTLDAIQFTYNNSAYTFDQFDLRMNRPDLVLQRIGRIDPALVKTYYSAWKKRLSRMKIQERELTQEIHLPVVRLQDKHQVQVATTKKEFEFTVECTDSRYPLRSLQVMVNNSPVMGISGQDLRPLNAQQTIQKAKIQLQNGPNMVKVFCTNSKGAVSLPETFTIISKDVNTDEAKTYFIGIAVASYKDSRMDLRYSVKDVRDLADIFSRLYRNIEIDTLIDRNVTKERILAIKKKLQQTTVNDRVILAVTGHGLLSDSLDFYYATWDVNFNSPEGRGLKYEELENLLTNIPARQKLMLIDACHSGALDKEELLALQKDVAVAKTNVVPGQKGVKGIAPRGFGLKNKQGKMEANSSFEMMQNLFTDLSGSNGAVVISAAGGMEYAFESDQWTNGVFTYCVRLGLDNKTADLESGNMDDKLTVRELLIYVGRKVSELTNGKQKPTSRRENIEYDWRLR